MATEQLTDPMQLSPQERFSAAHAANLSGEFNSSASSAVVDAVAELGFDVVAITVGEDGQRQYELQQDGEFAGANTS